MIETIKKAWSEKTGARMAIVVSLLNIILCVACSRSTVYPEAPVVGNEVVIDAKTLDPDAPRFFTYHGRGDAVNFFVLRTGSEVFAFLDACKICKPPLGYTFHDGFFTCKVCGERHRVAGIKMGKGACRPVQISGKLENGEYHVHISELRMPT
jgi:uncharacterized membrane protein